MEEGYNEDSDGGSGGSTPVQDENEDFDGEDEEVQVPRDDFTVTQSPRSPGEVSGEGEDEGDDSDVRRDGGTEEDGDWQREAEAREMSDDDQIEQEAEAVSEAGSEDEVVDDGDGGMMEEVGERVEYAEEADEEEEEEAAQPAISDQEEDGEEILGTEAPAGVPISSGEEEGNEEMAEDHEDGEPRFEGEAEVSDTERRIEEDDVEDISAEEEEKEDEDERQPDEAEDQQIGEEEDEQVEREDDRIENEDERVENEDGEAEVKGVEEDTPLSPALDIVSPEEYTEAVSPEEFPDEDKSDGEMNRADEDAGEEAVDGEEEEDASMEQEEVAVAKESEDEDDTVEKEDERPQRAVESTGDADIYEGADQVSDAEEEEAVGGDGEGKAEEMEEDDDIEEQEDKTENRAKPAESDDEEAVLPLEIEDATPSSPIEGQVAAGDNREDAVPGSQGAKDADSGEESDEEKELIADIFGSSDEEGEEFEGFGENELEPATNKKKAVISSDDDDDDNNDEDEPSAAAAGEEEETVGAAGDADPAEEKPTVDAGSDSDDGVDDDKKYDRPDFVSDFDVMMAKRKAEQGRRRKRRDIDIINDNDDIIMAMITKMTEAAQADHALNREKKAAVKKLLMYTTIIQQLQKADLQQTLLECGILTAMKEWLMPLPDKSLPHIKIRTSFLKLLKSFPPISQDLLKSSGIGKAVMILYRHPKELRMNKELAGRIINDWSRPIFGVDDSFLAISKEERQHRDLAQLSAVKRRRLSSQEGDRPKTIENALEQAGKALRPGDKGWIGRARVPMPSNKDYLVRPRSNVEAEFSVKSFRKSSPSKLDKHLQKMKAKSRNPNARAVNVNIAGAKMSL